MAEEVLDEGGAIADEDCVLIINSTEISSASFVRLSDEQQANIRDFTTTTNGRPLDIGFSHKCTARYPQKL